MNRYRFDDSLDEKGKKKHIHLLDEKPLIGTTTSLKNVSKEGLPYWASGMACTEFGWIKPLKPWNKPRPTKAQVEENAKKRLASADAFMRRIASMAADGAADQYLALLDKAYSAHATTLKEKAETGTDMHAELERYVKHCIKGGGEPTSTFGYPPLQVEIFSEWALKNVKRFIASEGYSYSERLWVGCIFDVLYEDMQDRLVILDFKSSKEDYDTQFWQCAGNDIQISENGVLDKNGNLMYMPDRPISYYGVLPFGMEKPEPQFYYDTEGSKEAFVAAVVLHKKRAEFNEYKNNK